MDPTAELQCMQRVDANKLQQVVSFGVPSSVGLTPVADNVTAFLDVAVRLKESKIAALPMILGSNANEGTEFGAFNESGMSLQQYRNGFAIIGCPVSGETHRRADAGLVTYRYEYAGNFSNVSPLPWIGATHSAELPLLFGTHYEYRGNSTAFEWDVSASMQALWLSFASDPNKEPKNTAGFSWLKYKTGTDNMALFADSEKVAQLVSGDRVDSYCR